MRRIQVALIVNFMSLYIRGILCIDKVLEAFERAFEDSERMKFTVSLLLIRFKRWTQVRVLNSFLLCSRKM
jgi:hypothetical protein